MLSHSPESKILPWKILGEYKGAQLEELRYEQLLPYEANTPEIAGGNPFRILLGDFVTTEDGTGIVHTAPAFGADDYKVGKSTISVCWSWSTVRASSSTASANSATAM
ncbi:hypothetical protein ACQ86N_47710 [Puia sp. P3]|uniref:hypothetical protein n=1 Tax=Puia sp. P3 TaxID=3423952 RepID=UPI003D67C689